MNFETIKGNCDYRNVINGVDHCDYHMADCEDDCCPRWEAYQYKRELRTAFSTDVIIAHHAGDWIGGVIMGMVGAAACLTVLFFFNIIQFVPK